MILLPEKKYKIIYADPPWEYPESGTGKRSKGSVKRHYNTMPVENICALQIQKISEADTALFLWATFPKLSEAMRTMEAWGFRYIGAAFVWVKKNPKSGTNYWGMGHYTRANAEVCLLGVNEGFRASERVKSHRVHQIVEAPFEGHSRKPDEVRHRIVELLGDVPRIELFAREKVPGWDAWGNEV